MSHAPDQIAMAVYEHRTGVSAADVCRRYNISGPEFFHWKAKLSVQSASEASSQATLSDENLRLKKLLAEALLEIMALKEKVSM